MDKTGQIYILKPSDTRSPGHTEIKVGLLQDRRFTPTIVSGDVGTDKLRLTPNLLVNTLQSQPTKAGHNHSLQTLGGFSPQQKTLLAN